MIEQKDPLNAMVAFGRRRRCTRCRDGGKEAAEAAAVEVECADFPDDYADGKDELTLRDAVAEEDTAPILRFGSRWRAPSYRGRV